MHLAKEPQNTRNKTDKLEIDNSTIAGLSSIMGKIARQKINKEIEDLSNNINQLDLTDIYSTLYPRRV